MSVHDTAGALAHDPQQLEEAYQAARKAGQTDAFRQAIAAGHSAQPDDLLYAAWYYRLQYAAAQAKEHAIAWAWVIPLALLNALVFWLLSDDRFMIEFVTFRSGTRNFMPAFILLAGPVAAAFVLAYLTAVSRARPALSALIGAALLLAAAYVFLVYPRGGPIPFQEQYLTLMAMHLPLLSWAGVGVYLLAAHRDPADRFAFLIKSLEVFITGGLFVIAGGIFIAITVGLFEALRVTVPEAVQRLLIAGGAGLLPVVATAVIYDPARAPARQSFDEGLSKLLALLMRVLLPLTLLVLLVYLAFIPFNFRAPFDNRDVLIVYNAMLFAVVALLVGATPLHLRDLSPALAPWLRRAIVAVAALALLVSLYALAALLYRTTIDRLTPNRLAFLGWNVINIGLLALLLIRQARAGAATWVAELQRAYSSGTAAYVVWTLAMILLLPWLFGVTQGDISGLPDTVQQIIYEEPDPILLKCYGSDPIYLLENGRKRWIDSIPTFEARGYQWRDVEFVSCEDLRAVPDGVPIPPEAGPPPQP